MVMEKTRSTARKDVSSRAGLVIGIAFICAVIVFGGIVVSRSIVDDGPLRSIGASPGSSHPSAGVGMVTLEDLERELAEEAGARRALAERISELEAKFAPPKFQGEEVAAILEERIGLFSSLDDASSDQRARSADGKASRFDDEVLFALGLDQHDAFRLRDSWVRHELDRAELLDRSLREGWFLSDRRGWELSKLDQAFREELQDLDYDRYLYALGQKNRVRISEVLEGSLASEAGLRSGDVILSYGDSRLFRAIDLLLASSRGQLGESVPVEILRDGHRQTVYINRGPLGAMTDADRGVPLDLGE